MELEKTDIIPGEGSGVFRGGDADLVGDVIVIGSGPAGLAAAISARDEGASVLLFEANYDIGGHGILSGGNVSLGGGNVLQKDLGIEDSPDLIFSDWVRHDINRSRYNDRDIVRTFADAAVETFDFLVENGVKFIPVPSKLGDFYKADNASVERVFQCEEWPVLSELIAPFRKRNGSGLLRTLERSARAKGVNIFLNHRMTEVMRPAKNGPVTGVRVSAPTGDLKVHARKAVILATGGSSGNVQLRRVFDPRLTEVYQHAGAPYSQQTGDGELAAMAVGASLWATANQTYGSPHAVTRTGHIGCRWGYHNLVFEPQSPVFHIARATGLTVKDWRNVITVNQAGDRFWNEDDHTLAYLDAALGYSEAPGKATTLNGGGPVWAIFDADALEREGWDPRPPYVDPDGYFATGGTIEELARAIDNPYQPGAISPARLAATVARYNGFVASGADEDFGRPDPAFPILRPPFYAAWATPIVHDTLTGLRTDTQANVLDYGGNRIEGLFCAGESQGGFTLHGLGRCLVFGRLAGLAAAAREPSLVPIALQSGA